MDVGIENSILSRLCRVPHPLDYGRFCIEPMGRIPIPLPPLATQQTIVAEIEAEQALVAANRELITRFEAKIQAILARVWGEETPAET